MKKVILLTLGACLGFLTTGANAKTFSQSVGAGNFEANLSAEKYEFDTNMITTTGGYLPPDFNRDFDAPVEREILTLRAAYGILNQLDVFAGIGYVNEEWTGDDKVSTSDYKETGKNPMFEIGLKGTIFKVLQDKMYFSYLLKYSYLESGEHFSGPNHADSSKAIWQEYNASLETGYNFESLGLTPYVGVSYFDIQGRQELNNYASIPNYDSDFENDNNFGCYLGLDYKLNDNVSLDLQGDFFIKTGLKLSASYVF